MERKLDDSTRAIIEAYRWQRGLGHQIVDTPYARVVRNPDHPEVWDGNHVDTVTAETPAQIDAVFQAMNDHLGHSAWRVIHTDPFTPEPFTARLALDGFEEHPAVIQMRLEGQVRARSITDLSPVESEIDWGALAALVRRDHDEGARTGGAVLAPEVTDGIVAGYRAKQRAYRFYLACIGGEPVAYGAFAATPSGAGIIEDLFTLPAYRRQGIASGMIAAFARELRACGCSSIFLGALVGEQARHLYAKLGFRPLMLTRRWVGSRAHQSDEPKGHARHTRATEP